MSENKLYLRLKQSNLIQNESFSTTPCRMREKAMGYMWEGEIKVTTIDGLKFVFFFWHHFHSDTGGDWHPSPNDLDAAWSPQFVPKQQSPTSELYDTYWHSFWVDNHLYVSKEGTFGGKRTKDEIIEKIKNGSWEKDSDLWMLI